MTEHVGVVAWSESEYRIVASGVDGAVMWVRPFAPMLGHRLSGLVVGPGVSGDMERYGVHRLAALRDWWDGLHCRLSPGVDLPPCPWDRGVSA